MKCKIRNQLIYFKRNAGNVLGHFDGRLRGIEVFTFNWSLLGTALYLFGVDLRVGVRQGV